MTYVEGLQVVYAGADLALQQAHGRVLLADDDQVCVMWLTGSLRNSSTTEYADDVLPLNARMASAHDELENSLDVGLVSIAVRDTYDVDGAVGVLNAMSTEGHLDAFASIAEDTVAYIAAKVRADASFRAVLAELEPEDGEEVVRLASLTLIRDAFVD